MRVVPTWQVGATLLFHGGVHVFTYLLDGLKFVTFEGSWSLKPHEAMTLEAALNWMPADMADLARKQLSQRYFVERQSHGRIPCFRYYRMEPDLRFNGRFRDGDHFIEVKLRTGKRKVTAKCVLHEGTVFGLEFPKPSSFFKNMKVEVASVSCEEASFSYTDVLNRAEHGPD